jgi:septum formation protein
MTLTLPKPIILASVSPRRASLLRQIGIEAAILPSSFDEDLTSSRNPREIVEWNALRKALDVARGIQSGIVVGADTIVVLDGTIFGKPVDAADAKRMLRMLSGKEHTVFSGFAIVDRPSGERVVDTVQTQVRFRELADDEIEEYVASGSPMDKAGAYGIQDDYGAVFVERIEGDFYTVVGFPLTRFYMRLKELLSRSGERSCPSGQQGNS